MVDIHIGLPPACANYKRPKGVMGGPCLNCGQSQPDHVHRRAQVKQILTPHSRPEPQVQGCICPPTSEKTCENPKCPRQDHRTMGDKMRENNP